MADLSWIKLCLFIFDDEKIKYFQTLKEKNLIIYLWIRLLVQAGKTNLDGAICMDKNTPYTLNMLSIIFERTSKQIESALSLFEELNMIRIDKKGIIYIINWEKHQNVEGMAKIRADQRERVKRHRRFAKQEKLFLKSKCNVTGTKDNVLHNNEVTNDNKNVTVQNRKEENIEKENREERKEIEDNNMKEYYNDMLKKILSRTEDINS